MAMLKRNCCTHRRDDLMPWNLVGQACLKGRARFLIWSIPELEDSKKESLVHLHPRAHPMRLRTTFDG